MTTLELIRAVRTQSALDKALDLLMLLGPYGVVCEEDVHEVVDEEVSAVQREGLLLEAA